jgi:hypothetical protein
MAMKMTTSSMARRKAGSARAVVKLSRPTNGQALARSFARHREVRALDLAGDGPASARSYDRAGRLVEVAASPDGHLRVPVAPGGFTVASR